MDSSKTDDAHLQAEITRALQVLALAASARSGSLVESAMRLRALADIESMMDVAALGALAVSIQARAVRRD